MTECITEMKNATEVIKKELNNTNNALARMADALKKAADEINASNERIMKSKEQESEV